jgi:hypothetical protein
MEIWCIKIKNPMNSTLKVTSLVLLSLVGVAIFTVWFETKGVTAATVSVVRPRIQEIATPRRIIGFYHVWLPNDLSQKNRLEILLNTQLEIILNSTAVTETHEIHVKIVSESESLRLQAQRLVVQYLTLSWLNLDIEHVSTHDTTEAYTLDALNTYCKTTDSPSDLVWYVHDKGAFHGTPGNMKLMPAATEHALSAGCLDQIDHHDADVCGLRWVRYPYVHYAGSNMWIAKCSYIGCLPNVTTATKLRCGKDGPIYPDGTLVGRMEPWHAGCDRFASEHWIGLGSNYVHASDCLGYLTEADGTVRTYYRDYLNLDFEKYGISCSYAPKPELEVAFEEKRIPDLPKYNPKPYMIFKEINLLADAAHFPK